MKIDIEVANLEQLQEWATKTQEIAERLELPKFSFFFGYCLECMESVHYPKAIVIHDKLESFNIVCEKCNTVLSDRYKGVNNGESKK